MKKQTWREVVWDRGYDIQKRNGIFGYVLDYFWPIKVNFRTPSFISTNIDGEVIKSEDGIIWTLA